MNVSTYSWELTKGWSGDLSAHNPSDNSLVLFFSGLSAEAAAPLIEDVARQWPNARIMGCSTAGEILGTDLFLEGAVMALIEFGRTRLNMVSRKINSAVESFQVGKDLAQELASEDLSSTFLLSEGLLINGSQLMAGFNDLGTQNLSGGLAGDGDRFESTWTVVDGKPVSGFVTAVGFYGDHLRTSHASRGGWDMLGPERLVTRAQDNVLYELDGQPALDVYKRYLGELADGLPSTGLLFPLAIVADNGGHEDKVRTILAVDEEQQSMTFAGDIPVGSYVKLMRANFDRLIDGASEASEALEKQEAISGDAICLSISCVGRRLVLGQRTEEEIEAVLEALPSGTRQIGFYSYGELSPLATGQCDLHNQTMTLTLLHET